MALNFKKAVKKKGSTNELEEKYVWKPKVGESIQKIRIVPFEYQGDEYLESQLSEDNDCLVTIYEHSDRVIPYDTYGKNVVNMRTFGAKDPIEVKGWELYNDKDSSIKEIGKKMLPLERKYFLCYDVNDENKFPKIWRTSNTVLEMLLSFATDEDNNEIDFTSLTEGRTVIIKTKDDKFNGNPYAKITSVSLSKYETPAFEKGEKKPFYEKAISPFELVEVRSISELKQDLARFISTESEEDEDDEPIVKKSPKKKVDDDDDEDDIPVKKGKKAPIEEEEDEEELPPIKSKKKVAEEEEEETPPAKKTKRKIEDEEEEEETPPAKKSKAKAKDFSGLIGKKSKFDNEEEE